MSQTTTAFLGAGSMSGAILAGMLRSGNGPVIATNRSREKAEALAARHAGSGSSFEAIALDTEPDGNRRAAASADLVVLGVKPYGIVDLARAIADSVRPGAVVVSVAVGTPTGAIEAVLPESVSVVRAMPNTPSHVGLGVTGVAAGARATDEQVALATQLFEAVGEVLVVDESQIDALSTISGSGPAYVFLLMEELTAVATRMGFSPQQAATMVQGTFRGASELLAAEGLDPAELRRRVTSPNGTTERAIAVLQDARLGEVFDRATAAALARARELAAE